MVVSSILLSEGKQLQYSVPPNRKAIYSNCFFPGRDEQCILLLAEEMTFSLE